MCLMGISHPRHCIDDDTSFKYENSDDPIHLGLGELAGLMLSECCWGSCNLTNKYCNYMIPKSKISIHTKDVMS